MAVEMKAINEAIWREELDALMARLDRQPADVAKDSKSSGWKVALAAVMKVRTTATNRWLGEALNMGGLHEVSRQVGRWKTSPDQALLRKLK